MGRTAVIAQPTYLPWLGYFELIATADVVVFLDTVQFEKQSWQCRNRLKGSNGQPFWLSVPLMEHALATSLREIRISPKQGTWRKKHLRSIEIQLGAGPYFRELFPRVQTWLNTEYEYLADLNIDGIKMFSEMLALSPRFVRASELNPKGHKTELVVDLCRQVGADRYYSSAGSKEYLEERLFTETGVELTYQAWEHPTYRQRGDGFVSHLSALDALMNIGPQATHALITGAGSERGNG